MTRVERWIPVSAKRLVDGRVCSRRSNHHWSELTFRGALCAEIDSQFSFVTSFATRNSVQKTVLFCKRSRQELNLVYDLRRVACIPHTPRTGIVSSTQRDKNIPTWIRTRAGHRPKGWSLRRVQCNPQHHRDGLSRKPRVQSREPEAKMLALDSPLSALDLKSS